MPVLIPLDENGNSIEEIKLTDFDLQEIYSTLLMGLDYNPQDDKFDIKDLLSYIPEPTYEKWLTRLKKINANEPMSFTLEDWLNEWYICDFIGDTKIKIALLKN